MSDRRALLAGAAALAFAVAPFGWASTFSADEFTFMSDALRMLRGEVLYRDFFQFTMPVAQALLAAAFAVAGPSLLVAHALQAALVWGAAVLAWCLARALGAGPWAAWLPGAALAVGLYPHYPGYNHHWVALPAVLGALLAGAAALRGGRARTWALAGALAALAFLTVFADGAVLLVAFLAAPPLAAWLAGRPLATALRPLAAFLAGFAAPVALAAGWLAALGALGVGFFDVFVWPLAFYRGSGGVNDVAFASDLPGLLMPIRGLPGWFGRVAHYVLQYALFGAAFMASLAFGLGLLARRARGAAGNEAVDDAPLGLAALAALGFLALSTRGRADFVHVGMYMVPGLVALVALLPRFPGRSAGRAALAVFALTGAGMVAKGVWQDPATWRSPRPPDARMREAPIIAWLQANARPGDRMVALPAGGFYYFYGPPPATRNPYVLPPDQGYTPEAEWRAVGAEIATNRPRFVVIAPWPWGDEATVYGQYAALLPPGYREAARLRTPQWGGLWPAVVWEDAGRP